MRIPNLAWMGVATAVLSVACGSSAPQVASPQKAIAPPTVEKVAEPQADLSPVPAPPGLVMVGRWRQPSATVDTLLSWSNLPINWRALLSQNGGGVGAIVAVDAPVDVAMSLPDAAERSTSKARLVVSLGLSSLDSALKFADTQGVEVQRVAPGVYRVAEKSGIECAAASSLGTAPARLVCGTDYADVEALLPYVTRGLPTEELGSSEVHLELRFEPLRPIAQDLRKKALALVLNEFSSDDTKFDRALAELSRGALDELAFMTDDADRLGIDLDLDQKSGFAKAVLSARFRSGKSWIVQSLGDMDRTAGPPPPMFWRLPSDSDGAGFSAALEPKRFDWTRRMISDLISAGFSAKSSVRNAVSPRVRDELLALVDELFSSRSTRVSAHGVVPPGQNPLRRFERVRRAIGWHIVGYESEAASKFIAPLGRVVRLVNDPQLRQALGAADLPKLTERSAAELAPGAKLYELVISEPAPTNSVGARAARDTGRPRATGKAELTITLAVVPAGQGTWLGFSADSKALFERLRGLDKGESSTSLAGVPALADIRNARLMGGGFSTLRGLVGILAAVAGERHAADRFLGMAPNHGASPMVTRLSMKRGAATDLIWEVQVPKAVVNDLAAGVPSLLGGGFSGESDGD